MASRDIQANRHGKLLGEAFKLQFAEVRHDARWLHPEPCFFRTPVSGPCFLTRSCFPLRPFSPFSAPFASTLLVPAIGRLMLTEFRDLFSVTPSRSSRQLRYFDLRSLRCHPALIVDPGEHQFAGFGSHGIEHEVRIGGHRN